MIPRLFWFKLNVSNEAETEALPVAEANAEAAALADPQLPDGMDQTQFVMGLAAAVESASGGGGSSGGSSGCSCKKKKRKSCSEC